MGVYYGFMYALWGLTQLDLFLSKSCCVEINIRRVTLSNGKTTGMELGKYAC